MAAACLDNPRWGWHESQRPFLTALDRERGEAAATADGRDDGDGGGTDGAACSAAVKTASAATGEAADTSECPRDAVAEDAPSTIESADTSADSVARAYHESKHVCSDSGGESVGASCSAEGACAS